MQMFSIRYLENTWEKQLISVPAVQAQEDLSAPRKYPSKKQLDFFFIKEITDQPTTEI